MSYVGRTAFRLLAGPGILLCGSLMNVLVNARTVDGFFMYCTSNIDGTGSCVNQEDNRPFTCLIVPGQIITCPAKKSATVDCVWISGVTANQAQFWCDASDEAALYGFAASATQPDESADGPNAQTTAPPPNDDDLDNNVFHDAF